MTYETEASFCDDFIAYCKAHGWTSYPEQGGWDIVLVRGHVQIGIQAKLVANNKVLTQALPEDPQSTIGPHYRAVLVGSFRGRTPAAKNSNREMFTRMARASKLLVFDPTPAMRQAWAARQGKLWLPIGYHGNLSARRRVSVRWRWYRWRTRKLVWLPPFVPVHGAGVPNPVTVSPWKVAAVKLELVHIEKGYICLDDARSVIEDVGGTFKPSSLLNAFWQCTGARIKGSRQKQWKQMQSPSMTWPAVGKAMGVP